MTNTSQAPRPFALCQSHISQSQLRRVGQSCVSQVGAFSGVAQGPGREPGWIGRALRTVSERA